MFLSRFALLATFIAISNAVEAQEVPWNAPLVGPVILTVTGLDPERFPDGRQEFDVARLQSLGEHQITTSSMWTKGVHLYTGVMLRTLADHLILDDRDLKLHALNDYAIDMPLSEATPEGPMLAYLLDGAQMSVRDKGPIWVIYPFDSDAKFRKDQIYARSVWQLVRIEVLP